MLNRKRKYISIYHNINQGKIENNYKRNKNFFNNKDPFNSNFKQNSEISENDNYSDNDDDYFNGSDKLHNIDMKVDTLEDMIKLGESYDINCPKKYVINLKLLNKCVPTLKRLSRLIGMKSIKKHIVDLIFFNLQNFKHDNSGKNMNNTLFFGSPGTGKTEVSKIIGKLYYQLNLVHKDLFIVVKLTDLIGKYVGHTEANVEKLFERAEGGIIFLDEAYSLGNKDRPTSFGKVAIDMINERMTRDNENNKKQNNHKEKAITFFAAGYEKEMYESFLSVNPGLVSRFFFRFHTDKYNYRELKKIYEKMVEDDDWKLCKNRPLQLKFFKENMSYFKNFGRDMQRLWQLTKMSHSKRVFGKDINLRSFINQEDLENAFKMFVSEDEIKNKNRMSKLVSSLYT